MWIMIISNKDNKRTKERRDMLKGLEYETVLVRMVMALVAAIVVVMGLIILMGIQLTTCNPFVLTFGVVAVTAIFTVSSFV